MKLLPKRKKTPRVDKVIQESGWLRKIVNKGWKHLKLGVKNTRKQDAKAG